MPERWREEVFVAQAKADVSSESDSRLVVFIVASGEEYDLHSPYGVSMRFGEANVDAEAVVINNFVATIEDREIPEISLYNIHTRSPVELGTKSVDLHPAPCCLFMVASERFDLEHTQGEILSVQLDYCLVVSGKNECKFEERQFRAVVRQGSFTMGGV